MREFSTEAIVLASEESGDYDSRVTLFTKEAGKLVARAKSIRKITSKLAGHVQAGFLIRARIIERSGFQIVDALRVRRVHGSPPDLFLLHTLLPELEREESAWNFIVSAPFAWPEMLRILGWDSKGARCAQCDSVPTRYFGRTTQEYYCGECASTARDFDVFCIDLATAAVPPGRTATAYER